jgi:hypothetical protein
MHTKISVYGRAGCTEGKDANFHTFLAPNIFQQYFAVAGANRKECAAHTT